MKLTSTAFTAFLLFTNHVGETDATSIKMDYLPASFARTDPIISQTCLSGEWTSHENGTLEKRLSPIHYLSQFGSYFSLAVFLASVLS